MLLDLRAGFREGMTSLQTDIMKTSVVAISTSALVGLGLLTASALNVAAQISVAPNVSTPAPAAQAAPVRLSYGVADVVKLAKAHVSEDTILAYVGNSGTAYNLSVNEILFLKEQGVSDRVLAAMLDQRNRLAAAAAQNAQAAPAPPPANYPDAGAPQYAPAAAQPGPYAQDPAAAAPASSVYVIPGASPSYVYPGDYSSYSYGYPYYGGYGGYGGYHGGYGGYHGGSGSGGHR
jgi:hypothetical protein